MGYRPEICQRACNLPRSGSEVYNLLHESDKQEVGMGRSILALQRKALARSQALLTGTLVLLLVACGVNPVTGQRELSLISESEEVALGEQNYGPTQQSQWGELVVDPQLT